MGTVVSDFKGLASNYAAQLRADVASSGSSTLIVAANFIAAAQTRLQQLLDVGLLRLSRAPTDPIDEEDCTVLGVLCDSADPTYQVFLTMVSAAGRFYSCGTLEGGTISTVSLNGSVYNESHLTWLPYSSSVSTAARKSMKQRCLSDAPEVVSVGMNCPQPRSCQCGADQRCAQWYRWYENATSSYFISKVYANELGVPELHGAMSLVNSSTTPPTLLGVVQSLSTLVGMQYVLSSLVGASDGMYLAMLMNDTNLTTAGSIVRQCNANETPPGDPSLPLWSSLRSCDPGLRAVAQQLANNRSVSQAFSMEAYGLLWEVTVLKATSFSGFFILGYNKSTANEAIDASEAVALSGLSTVQTDLLQQVANRGAATRAYMSTVGQENVQATQALQSTFVTEIHALENTSLATLAATQNSSTSAAQAEIDTQTAAVEMLKTTQLDAMATTAGWTIGVVFAILLVVLFLSMWGTIHITNHLAHIIDLMEDVAEMKVENLTVPQGSHVQEVARIQTAFQVMVERLSEYKSYIPAGVFEKMGRKEEELRDDGSDGGCPSEHLASSESGRCKSKRAKRMSTSDGSEAASVRNLSSSGGGGALPPSPTRKSVRKHVSVLSINVSGFMDMLLSTNDGLCKSIFNDYVVLVHEAVSQNRGNIDYLAGDQIFATFNAHIPCGDPAGAVVAAALDVRQQLFSKLGDRLKFHVGLSFGPVFASSVGYAKFKFMVTVGSPTKVASILAHMNDFESGTILVDFNLEQRMRYSYTLRPVELLYLPWLKSFAKDLPASQRTFQLVNKKELQEDEWLYQVEETGASDWNSTFEMLVAATSSQGAQSLLHRYLSDHPDDALALRLKDRLALWVPGRGIRV
eukprot:GGOE01031793.1.p1 GENE.GGOE01031793.1~~GGOE01031793.1.p1  ORF type:complete len:987 (-),score=303.47 GGOE01031793.1:1084-3660(-)